MKFEGTRKGTGVANVDAVHSQARTDRLEWRDGHISRRIVGQHVILSEVEESPAQSDVSVGNTLDNELERKHRQPRGLLCITCCARDQRPPPHQPSPALRQSFDPSTCSGDRLGFCDSPSRGECSDRRTGNDPTVWVQTAVQTVSFAASDIASPRSNYINFILALIRPATPDPTATPGVHSVVVEPQWYYPEFAMHATDACKDEPMRSADEDGRGYDWKT